MYVFRSFVYVFRSFMYALQQILKDSMISIVMKPMMSCEACNFNTYVLSNYNKHLSTMKHYKKVTNSENDSEKSTYKCKECDKTYKSVRSRWYHQKKCEGIKQTPQKCDAPFDAPFASLNKEQVIEVFQHMSELKDKHIADLKDQHLVVMKTMQSGSGGTTNNFNLNVFLNDTCKDAMNIMDFVKTIQINYNDFEKMGEIGYANGLSQIILKSLKEMDMHCRPIHCVDGKREVIYIKDDDKWEKEENGNPKIRKAIKQISHKNSKMINEYKILNPHYNNSSSKVSDKYNRLLIESMGGKGDDDALKENKIIRNITKEVLIRERC